MRRVGLTDIARITGYGFTTVQRVMSGSPHVAEATRLAILEAAARLDYRPNASARAVRRGRFDAVGLLAPVDWRRGNLTIELIDGIERTLLRRGMALVQSRIDDADLEGGTTPQLIGQTMIDGLLVKYDNHLPARLVELIERFRIPTLWLNLKLPFDCVHPDDRDAARSVTTRLMDLGHRRIAYLDLSYDPGSTGEHYSSEDRYAGYRMAMEAAGLGVRAIRRRVDLSERPQVVRALLMDGITAVIAYGEAVAWNVVQVAQALELQVPQRISVCTIDGRLPPYLGVELSGTVIEQWRLGGAACERLLEKLEQPAGKLPPLAIPFTPVVGGTAGPAPAR